MTYIACRTYGICRSRCCEYMYAGNANIDLRHTTSFRRGAWSWKHYSVLPKSSMTEEEAKKLAEGWITGRFVYAVEAARKCKCRAALVAFGHGLHTLQDKYSHGREGETGELLPKREWADPIDYWRETDPGSAEGRLYRQRYG